MINIHPHALSDYAVPAGSVLLSLLPSLGRLRALPIAGPLYQLGNTLLSRHEGGVVPVIPMRTHLVFDAAGAGVLARRRPAWQRRLFAAIGATKLIEIAFSDDRDAPARDRVEIVA